MSIPSTKTGSSCENLMILILSEDESGRTCGLDKTMLLGGLPTFVRPEYRACMTTSVLAIVKVSRRLWKNVKTRKKL